MDDKKPSATSNRSAALVPAVEGVRVLDPEYLLEEMILFTTLFVANENSLADDENQDTTDNQHYRLQVTGQELRRELLWNRRRLGLEEEVSDWTLLELGRHVLLEMTGPNDGQAPTLSQFHLAVADALRLHNSSGEDTVAFIGGAVESTSAGADGASTGTHTSSVVLDEGTVASFDLRDVPDSQAAAEADGMPLLSNLHVAGPGLAQEAHNPILWEITTATHPLLIAPKPQTAKKAPQGQPREGGIKRPADVAEQPKKKKAPAKCTFCKKPKKGSCVCVKSFPKNLVRDIRKALPPGEVRDAVDEYLKKLRRKEKDTKRRRKKALEKNQAADKPTDTTTTTRSGGYKCEVCGKKKLKGHICEGDRFPRELLEQARQAIPPSRTTLAGQIDTYLHSGQGEVNLVHHYRNRQEEISETDQPAVEATPSPLPSDSEDGNGHGATSNAGSGRSEQMVPRMIEEERCIEAASEGYFLGNRLTIQPYITMGPSFIAIQ